MTKRRQPTPPVPEPKIFSSIQEIDQAITKLSRRIAEVERLATENATCDAPEVHATEQAIRNTILEIYGSESSEYQENRYLSLFPQPRIIDVNRPHEREQCFENRLPHVLAILRQLVSSLNEKKEDLAAAPRPKISQAGGRVFIGHGRSAVWKDLKEFLEDRLRLECDEFNREPAAGLTIQERLNQMLDSACFAFLVMTAEDVRPDGTVHSRENVIHEAGLFQGRHGFKRAIVLLEEGCAKFSNIQGLVYISFPKDNIVAASEKIREVLEREGILSKI